MGGGHVAYIKTILEPGRLPTIFFVTESWAGVLASRYTYLARIGPVVALAGNFSIGGMKRRWLFALIIAITAVWGITFWVKVVTREYGYIYQTGRSLQQAAAMEIAPLQLLVTDDRPFRNNRADVVGAMYDIAGLVANQIIFLEPGAPRTLREGEALLWWDAAGRSYRVRGATSRKP